MRECIIRKKSGGVRHICIPSHAERRYLRSCLPRLQGIAMLLDVHEVQHGFTPARSPVTNAAAHIGFRWTATCDLKDCFDAVTASYCERAAGCSFAPTLFVNGVARQGLPTSPSLCNIALSPMDASIVELLAGRGVYTRYADDLTVSSHDRDVLDEFLAALPHLAATVGQTVNLAKTRVQCEDGGRRIVTGVAVSYTNIAPTRAAKRRERAARHQQHKHAAAGLAEWNRLRTPNWIRAAVRVLDCGTNSHTMLATLIASRHRPNCM